MSRKLNTPISPASVLALVALFVALGGVSYAAGTIGTADIQNGAVTAKKLHRFAVTPGKIRNGAVNRRKLRKNSVTGHKVVESTLGQVPSAAQADQAESADSATSAQDAVNAQNAVNAQSAVSAQSADSVGTNGVDKAAVQSSAVGASELRSVVRRTSATSIANNDSKFGYASCNSGEQMLSGGANWGGGNLDAAGPDLRIAYSYPIGTTIWGARGYNTSGVTRDFIVSVLCLRP